MTDQRLIKKILNGDKTSLREYYHNYKSRLLSYILRKVSAREDAEEILQDVFLESLDALRDFTGRCSLFTFICSIASHKIIDYYRRKKIKNILFSQLPEDIKPLISQILTPEEEYSLTELKNQIEVVLSTIKPKHKLIIKLKYIEGFSVIEIAKKLVITSKSVESSLFRARMEFIKQYRLLYADER